MSDQYPRDRQIFAWTGATPVGVGYASFMQAFDLEGLTRFVIRGGDGVTHHIDIPREKAFELASNIDAMNDEDHD